MANVVESSNVPEFKIVEDSIPEYKLDVPEFQLVDIEENEPLDIKLTKFLKRTPLKGAVEIGEHLTKKPIPSGNSLDWATGVGQALPAVISGIPSAIRGVAGGTGAAAGGATPEEAKYIEEAIAAQTTYQPDTETGKYLTEIINAPIGGIISTATDIAHRMRKFGKETGLTDPLENTAKSLGVPSGLVDYGSDTAVAFASVGKPLTMITRGLAKVGRAPGEAIKAATEKNTAKRNAAFTEQAIKKTQSTIPKVKVQGEAELAAMRESGATPYVDTGTPLPSIIPVTSRPAPGADTLTDMAAQAEKTLLSRRNKTKKPFKATVPEEPITSVGVQVEGALSPKNVESVIPKEPPFIPTLTTGAPIVYRNKRYTFDQVLPDGRLQVFGLNKNGNPISLPPKHVRLINEPPVDVASFKGDMHTLRRAGYSDSELIHKTHAEVKEILTERSKNIEAPPTLEQLNAATLAAENIKKFVQEKGKANIQLLLDNGWTPDEIARAQEYQISAAARDLREGKVPDLSKPKDSVQIKQKMDYLKEAMGKYKDKKIEDLTSEEMAELGKDLVDNDVSDFVDDFTKESGLFRKLSETSELTSAKAVELDNAEVNRAIDVAASVGDANAILLQSEMKGKILDPREVLEKIIKARGVVAQPIVTSKKNVILRKRDAKAVEVQKIAEWTKEHQDIVDKMEIEEPTETHRPGRRGYKDVDELSLDELMEDSGEPKELNFLKKKDFTLLKNLFEDDPIAGYEKIMPLFFKDKITGGKLLDDLINGIGEKYGEKGKDVASNMITDFQEGLRQYSVALDNVRTIEHPTVMDSRRMTTGAHRYLPSEFTKRFTKEEYLKQVKAIEDAAGINDRVYRTGPNPKEAIDIYVEKGRVTPEQAIVMKSIVDNLNGKAKFGLLILEEDAAVDFLGTYNFTNNLMRLKDKKAITHEVGHFAEFNLLTGDERVQFVKSIVNQFYENNKLSRKALAEHLRTDNYAEMINPSEIFAKEFENYSLNKIDKTWNKVVMDKVKRFMQGILSDAIKSMKDGYIPSDRLELYERILSESAELAGGKGRPISGGRRYIPTSKSKEAISSLPEDEMAKRVTHGTDKLFDRFLDRCIGSGEGAQIRGWGHYLTSGDAVSKWYAENMARKALRRNREEFGVVGPTGKYVSTPGIPDHVLDALWLDIKKGTREPVEVVLDYKRNTVDPMIKILDMEHWRTTPNIVERSVKAQRISYGLDLLAEQMQKGEAFFKAQEMGKKVVHDVELPDDLNLLDLDKPVPENQNTAIVEAINKRITEGEPEYVTDRDGRRTGGLGMLRDELKRSAEIKYIPSGVLTKNVIDPFTGKVLCREGHYLTKGELDNLDNAFGIERVQMKPADAPPGTKGEYYSTHPPIDGESLQQLLWKALGGKRKTSNFLLNDVGIHGNTYTGETSGVRNYVIFDENIPKIVGSTILDFMGMGKGYEMLQKLFKRVQNREQNPITRITDEMGRSDDAVRIKEGMPPKTDKFGNIIEQPIKPNDPFIMPFSDWWRQSTGEPIIPGQPKPLLRGGGGWSAGTPVESIVVKINKGEGLAAFHHANNMIGLRETQDFLRKNNITNEQLTDYMRNKVGEETPAMLEAAGKVREYLDRSRDNYRDFLKGEYARFLTLRQVGALNDLIAGKPMMEVIRKWELKKPKKQKEGEPLADTDANSRVIENIWENYKKIENWGIDDYLSNVELGSYRILSPDKTVVAVALSKEHAVQKILEMIDKYPEWKGDFYIDNTPRSVLNESLTGIGNRKQYYAIVGKLAKAIESEIEGIDKGLAREMADSTIKKQFTVKPADVYSEFAQERKGYLEGEPDVFPVLARYSRIMEKKMALDPVIHEWKHQVKPGIENRFLVDKVDRIMEDVKGKYWGLDQVVDAVIGLLYNSSVGKALNLDVGKPPVALASRSLGRIRQFEANIKLGWRPVNAAVNLASGQGHVWAKVGEGPIIKAWQMKNTPEGQALLAELGPYMGMSFIEESAGTFSTRRGGESKPWTYGKPMGLFQAAEVPNREVGLLANYYMARDKFGMSEKAAKEVAIQANWFQNFTYNIANQPKVLRGPFGRTVGQFKPYLFKELEFISTLRTPELARYMGMQLALGGPRAAMYILKSLPIIGLVSSLDELERYVNTVAPNMSRGIGGLPGAVGELTGNKEAARIGQEMSGDVSALTAFQFPRSTQDLSGPSLSDLFNVHKVMSNVPDGTKMSLGTLNKVLVETTPFYRGWVDTWNNTITGNGMVRDPLTGKPARNQPLWEDTDDYIKKVIYKSMYGLKRLSGIQDIQTSVDKLEERMDVNIDQRNRDELDRTLELKVRLMSEGSPIPDSLIQHEMELREKTGIWDKDSTGLTDRIINQNVPPIVRRLRRKNQTQQIDVLEHEPEYE